ncbi:multinuclear nonheme iron-dependent oxidase [Derxia lacustris]|uniref:multinuclear nonheme iron-dependent oxidase n=1 Tax=Derxia lacustris TaxID=764842 RepID=UPI0015949688|nr:DUF692 family multinuclear iron-containing protein [Derxia lacustris]
MTTAPGIGGAVPVGIGLRAPHHAAFAAGLGPEHAARRPDWLEVHSENYFAEGGAAPALLDRLRADWAVSLHGVGLGLGSACGLDGAHLARLARLVRRVQPMLVSEHLCWGAVPGRHLNDLLPLPLDRATLALMVDRVSAVQDALGRGIAIENVSALLRAAGDEYDESGFLVELARRSGCRLLVDINNYAVNRHNLGVDARAALAAIPRELVAEVHLAGHSVVDGVAIDDHGSAVGAEVLALYGEFIARVGPVPTLIERDCAIPPLAELLDEAGAVRELARRRLAAGAPASPAVARPAAIAATAASAAERPPLADWQQAFADAIVDRDATPAFLPQCRLHEAGAASTTDAAALAHRLALYRGNLAAHAGTALRGAYPAIAEALGDDALDRIARQLIRQHPSRSGNLDAWGEALPGFLAGQAEPALADLARLDWARHLAWSAPDAPALALADLAAADPEAVADWRLASHPAAALVACDDGCRLVARPAQHADVWPLDPAQTRFFRQLAAGTPLGDAAATAGLDAAALMQTLALGIEAGAWLPPQPSSKALRHDRAALALDAD